MKYLFKWLFLGVAVIIASPVMMFFALCMLWHWNLKLPVQEFLAAIDAIVSGKEAISQQVTTKENVPAG